MPRKRIDVTGRKFGKLLVVELEHFDIGDKWKCQCDCGRIVYFSTLGEKCRKMSCGCLNKNKNYRKDPKILNKECECCGVIFQSESPTKKCCSPSCASRLKFIENPDLKILYATIGAETMKKIRFEGKAYVAKPGMHTDEFKKKLSERSVGPKSDETKKKMKENHWAYNDGIRETVIEKINESKRNSEKWNSEERRNLLSNIMMKRPELSTHNSFYHVGHFYNRFINDMEYHHSGFELRFMEFLDQNENVKFWTKRHKIFIEYIYENKIKKYWPDFFIEFKNSTKTIVELKGFKEDPEILQLKITAGEQYCIDRGFIYQIIYQEYNNDFKNLRDC